jgi:uncharacterized protein YceK
MNTLKNWGICSVILLSFIAVTGCGQVSSLTKGTDETGTQSHTQLLNSSNQEWQLLNGADETITYTNSSPETVSFTFAKLPLSGKIAYNIPTTTERQELELGTLSSLQTYQVGSGETQSWSIEGLPDDASNVVLTLFLIVNESYTTQEIVFN